MSEQSNDNHKEETYQPYDVPERKKEIIGMLKAQHEWNLDAADKLDAKAWSTLQITTIIVGLTSIVQISIVNDQNSKTYEGLLSFLNETSTDVSALYYIFICMGALCFLCHIVFLVFATRPIFWHFPLGAGLNTFEDFSELYLAGDNNDFYDQIIVDYIGDEGAIGLTKKLVNRKASWLQYALYSLIALLICLLGMGVALVVS